MHLINAVAAARMIAGIGQSNGNGGEAIPFGSFEWITYAGISCFLVLFAGIMSGLTLGLMSLGLVELEILQRSGTPNEKKQAAAIFPVVQKQHQLLVTLLLCNAMAMEGLPIYLDKLFNEYVAIILSVTFVLAFGEVIPQAICTRYGLAVGANFVWLVRILMILCYPIAFPIGKILDLVLGHNDALFRRAQLKALVSIHSQEAGKGGELTHDETTIISGALDLTEKTAQEAMTPIESTFSLDVNSKLDWEAMGKILARGHSRVPVYSGNPKNVIGLLLVKSLLTVRPETETLVSAVCIRRIPRVPADMPLYDILNEFQKGSSHMAAVVKVKGKGRVPPSTLLEENTYESNDSDLTAPLLLKRDGNHDNVIVTIDKANGQSFFQNNETGPHGFSHTSEAIEDGEVIGIITLEDVFEELLQEEIVDETDEYVDVHKRIRVAAAAAASSIARAPSSRKLLAQKGTVKNSRGDILQCSHYMPVERPEDRPLPCVIYCHGNSGCRADASEAAIVLLPSNITIFTLDFSGSGLSGGEYVTLGWNEKDDLKAVVEYLRTDGNVSLIGLWGRSMGAVTSLMYGAEDPSIAAMVLDSPFSDLVDLMMELVDTYKFRLPKFTIKFAIQYMRRAVQKKAKFDITELNTIKVAKSCFVPVLFGHAIDDDFIQPHHSERMYEAYIGDKNIIKFEGDHNSPRPQFYFDSINIFFHNVLQPPEVVGPTFFDPMDDYFAKGSWSTMQELSSPQSSAQKSIAAGSTSDAINEVRLKRPMSRTEVPCNDPSNQSSSETKEKENLEVSSSSSSDMISFDLSNGDPYPPHLAVALDDDQYVEFHVDELADFPSNAEEEERMLMEAVMKSLKDVEIETHQKKEASKTNSENTEEKESNAASSTTEPELAHSETSPSNHEATPSSETNGACKVSDSLPGTVNGFGPNASPKMSQNTNDVIDLSARTKATVTVVGRSSTSGNVLDGLLRRWDLNFFKSR